jgi:hypothetical protein
MSHPSHCSLHQEGFTYGEHPRRPTVWNAWFQQWNTGWGEVLWWFRQQYCATVFCWSHCYPSWSNYCKGVRGQVGLSGASHDPDVISKQWCNFTRQCPHSHSLNCLVMVWRAWRWTSASSLTSTITRLEYHWATLVSFGDKSEEQVPTSNICTATWRCSSRRMVQISIRDCLKLVWIHSKKDCSYTEGKSWFNTVLIEKFV